MKYVHIHRLRGSVADFTKSNGLLKVAFNHVGPTVDLTNEDWDLFIEELKEAREAFTTNETQEESTSDAPTVVDGDLDEEVDDDF